MEEQLNKVIACLNDAWERDPMAMRNMLMDGTPCNQQLADHPTVVVNQYEEGFTVGTLGIVNGVLETLGIGHVASRWSDETDEKGRHKFLGFGGWDSGEEDSDSEKT